MPDVFIRKLEGFAPLTDEDRRVLASIGTASRWLDARTDIVREGEVLPTVPLITQGLACRYKLVPDGRRQIMAYLVPGDLCDLHGYVLREMDHSIATISPCRIVEVPREAILGLLERPNIAKALRVATLVDEGTLREWVVNLGRRTAEQRVAHLLCEMLERLRAVGLAGEHGCELPLTQNDLADTVGLSAVHLNRTLRTLRMANLATFQQYRLHVPDPDRLREFGGFTPNYLHIGENSTAA